MMGSSQDWVKMRCTSFLIRTTRLCVLENGLLMSHNGCQMLLLERNVILSRWKE